MQQGLITFLLETIQWCHFGSSSQNETKLDLFFKPFRYFWFVSLVSLSFSLIISVSLSLKADIFLYWKFCYLAKIMLDILLLWTSGYSGLAEADITTSRQEQKEESQNWRDKTMKCDPTCGKEGINQIRPAEFLKSSQASFQHISDYYIWCDVLH